LHQMIVAEIYYWHRYFCRWRRSTSI